ncbi:distal tail protein Dit [Lactococcus lactis]|uniref:Phage tail protein n=1 Tax=Lactococcus lactis TaxID=1358 RepID=A0AAP8E099_9LACT|nr:distal tail protein Dit [Lactococcus lactis]MDG4972335.1 phage tail family protein [Lactococcus lactis]PFG88480.1 phage tail protein [Lactococcus lactis]
MRKVMKITYGGAELSKFFDSITNIKRNIGSTWENSTEKLGNGVDFLYNSRGSKIISFDYVLNGIFFNDINHNKDQLASLVNTKVPIELIFGDEPNKVWLALPDGEQSFDLDSGTLNFLVPSGEAESVDTKVLNESNSGGEFGTITHNSDGSTKVIINNQGSLETFPKIKITNVHENGYLGLVHENGILELGKRDEADGETNAVSEYLYDSKNDTTFSNFKDVVAGTVNPQSSLLATNGKIEFQNDGLRLKDAGTAEANQIIAGGMKVMTLPADSNGHVGAVNFYSYFNLFAWATAFGQTGVLQVMFTDSNDKLIAGYGIIKPDKSGNIAVMKGWVGGNNPREVISRDFAANNGEGSGSGSYNNTQFNQKTGHTDFLKQEDRLGFYWHGSRITISVPELKDVEVAKVYIYIGQYTNSNKFMTNLAIRNISYRKDKVSVWSDLPNRYQTGSIMEVDMENGKIINNGLASNNELVVGSEFISIPAGESELDIYQSSWNTTPPKIEIEWKERFL